MFSWLGKCSRLYVGIGLWYACRFQSVLWLGSRGGDLEEIMLNWSNMLPGSTVSLALGVN